MRATAIDQRVRCYKLNFHNSFNAADTDVTFLSLFYNTDVKHFYGSWSNTLVNVAVIPTSREFFFHHVRKRRMESAGTRWLMFQTGNVVANEITLQSGPINRASAVVPNLSGRGSIII